MQLHIAFFSHTHICQNTYAYSKTVVLLFKMCWLIGLSTLALLLSAKLGFAQQPLGLTVTPATQFVEAHMGEITTHTVTIKNTSQSTITIQPKIVDFASDGSTGHPILQEETIFPYFAPKTLDVLSQTFTLFAQQEHTFTIDIEVPENVLPQEYPMTILFQVQPLPYSPSDTLITGVVASNLIVLVSNELERTGITSGSINSLVIQDSILPLTFGIDLHNTSLSAEFASGSASIANWNNQIVARYEFVPDVILGKSKRRVRFIGDKQEPVFKQTYREFFLLGPYSITAETIKPDGSTHIVASKTVIALPIIWSGVVAIMSIGWMIWQTKKKPSA